MTIKKPISAHDVTAAYCLAMAEVRVRLPLGALFKTGCGEVWSNPRAMEARDRWFKSSHPDSAKRGIMKEKDNNAVVLVLVRVGDC